MSTPFAIDPALASNNTTTAPTTASPANLTKLPSVDPTSHSNPTPTPNAGPSPNPPSPGKQPSDPGYYSILPALPPLPGWGPFPGPMFTAPGPVIPMYIAPPPPWPEVAAPQTPKSATSAHYPNQTTTTTTHTFPPPPAVQTLPASSSSSPATTTFTAPAPKPRTRRADPPPINPAAAASPHYQNPGGFGGVYTPPSHLSSSSSNPQNTSTPGSHYSNPKSPQNSTTLTTLTSSGRQFACGQPGCTAAFDRKSDCERHRRTHVKAATEARPFRCARVGCEAAFDRKDALMRHERNERTHLVRQTQPGEGRRAKRPTRSGSKSELDPSDLPPRRQSTRKRKPLLSNTADMYASDEDQDESDSDEDDIPSTKRLRGVTASTDMDPSASGTDFTTTTGIDAATTTGLDPMTTTGIDPATAGMASTAEMEDMVDLGHEEGEGEGDQGGLVIDPQLHGLGGTDPMQAVEAIQAALQQIEADADAEKGRVGQ